MRRREEGGGEGNVVRRAWASSAQPSNWMPPRHKLRDVSVLLAPSMRAIALIPELSLPSLVSGFDSSDRRTSVLFELKDSPKALQARGPSSFSSSSSCIRDRVRAAC